MLVPVLNHNVETQDGKHVISRRPLVDQHTAFEQAIAAAVGEAFGEDRTLGVMTVWENQLPAPTKLYLFVAYRWWHRGAFKRGKAAIEAAVREYVGPGLPIEIRPMDWVVTAHIRWMARAQLKQQRAAEAAAHARP
jgi:hypothetical protein